jgi:hypothetical protein
LGSISGEAAAIGRQINLDHIGNKNSRDISPTCLDVRQLAIEDNLVNQSRQFWSLRVSAEQLAIRLGAGTAVTVLIGNGNQTLVEERVALPGNLDPGTKQLRVAISHRALGFIAQYLYLTAAGGCINANDLLVAAQLAYRNHQYHEMKVKPALGILAWRTKLQEVEYGIDVAIETIVTLACEREVTAA